MFIETTPFRNHSGTELRFIDIILLICAFVNPKYDGWNLAAGVWKIAL